MAKYQIEEVDDTPDFIIVIQIALAILFLPIGIIWGIIKLVNYFSDKAGGDQESQSAQCKICRATTASNTKTTGTYH